MRQLTKNLICPKRQQVSNRYPPTIDTRSTKTQMSYLVQIDPLVFFLKINLSLIIAKNIYHTFFYTPPHFSGEVLCYTLRCLSVCPSVRPCSPFPIDNLSIYSWNFFKFCIHIVIGDAWYGIVNGQNPSIFNGVTALFRIGKMVSGLLFLYCS